MPQVAVRSEHTLISSMRVSPDRTVYGCVLAEVLSSGWRWPDLRLGIPHRTKTHPSRQKSAWRYGAVTNVGGALVCVKELGIAGAANAAVPGRVGYGDRSSR
jgi:hypothetical protein